MEEKEIYGYVYMVKNLVNGKLYFGKTENGFNKRYSGNLEKYTHNDHLKHSIEKYGIENFEINEQFDVAYTKDELWDLEDLYICMYNTLDPTLGYNKRRSGSRYQGCGKFSEQSKQKLSHSQKKLYEDGYINPFKDKHHTEETRKKMSDSQKILYENGYENPLKGKKLEETSKKRMSDSKKELYKQGYENPFKEKSHTDETRKKISKTKKNIQATDETKRKMSEAKKGKKRGPNKKVMCIETEKIFNTTKDASEWCGVSQPLISGCCCNKRKTAGKHPITGEKLHWKYID